MELIVSLLLIGVFLFLVGVYAGAETGFVSLDLNSLKGLAKKPEAVTERELLKIALTPERFLALTLIGINMSIVIATSLATNLLEKHGPLFVSIGTAGLSFFVFLFCEVLPKIAFSANPFQNSMRVLPIIRLTGVLLAWPVAAFSLLTRKIMEWTGMRTERGKRKISREELLILLHMSATAGVIRDKPHRMLKGIIGLKGTRVCEVMVPRTRIEALDAAWSLPKARKVMAESGYSRLPVFEGSIDHIIGMVYFKDLLLKGFDQQNLKNVMGPVVFVPEVQNAYKLFQDMSTRRFQAAVVLDEFGTLSGFVTMEDLIEEVVGEIHDELDEPVTGIKVHNDGSMTVRADINLTALAEQIELSLPEEETATTLNGALLAFLGRIPLTGERFVMSGWTIEVVQADQRRIQIVRLFPRKEAE